MQKLNLKIKYREGFRPFAPSVLSESTRDFDLSVDSPYMLLVSPVLKERRKNLPEKYHDLDLYTKLYIERRMYNYYSLRLFCKSSNRS